MCNCMKDCYMDSMCDESKMDRPLCNMCGLTPLCPPNSVLPVEKKPKKQMDCKENTEINPMHMHDMQHCMYHNMQPGMHPGMQHCMCCPMMYNMMQNPMMGGCGHEMQNPMMGGCGQMSPMMGGCGQMGPMMGGYGQMSPMMDGCGQMSPMTCNRDLEFEEFDLDEE